MPTTVHIPKPLLVAVDRKARKLRISRNRLIIQALEREVSERGWSPGFAERLQAMPDPALSGAVDEMMAAIVASRTSKPPPKL